jgi:hypothetical protein
MAPKESSRNNPLPVSAAASGSPANSGRLSPAQDLPAYLEQYARERPEVVGLCCFIAGFLLGWKLKPW